MAFGFWHNVFETVASAFATATEPLGLAKAYIKDFFPDKEQIQTFTRRKRENRLFKRARPFVAELPGTLKPTQELFTPTSLMLGEKNQYLFKVKFRYSDRPADEFEYLSFLSGEDLTKTEAEYRMGKILMEKRQAERYANLTSIEMQLTGTRTTMWLP